MKTIVIYKSKTGFTKKYAQLIGKQLDCQTCSVKESKNINLANYDSVIFGGSLYASGILGLKKIKKRLKNHKLIVFPVGATPPKDGLIDELLAANFTSTEKESVKLFYLRGGFNFKGLNLIDKGLMLMMKRSIKKKDPKDRTPDEKGLLNAYEQPVDFTREKNIEPLITYYEEVIKDGENVH
jgi:menaquinone-dependent protoporphyrinogen IX oxidase